MRARDLDATDTTLRNSVVFKVVQALRHAARRKLVVMVEKRKGMCVWSAGPAITLHGRSIEGVLQRRLQSLPAMRPMMRTAPMVLLSSSAWANAVKVLPTVPSMSG
jgi:hypothetical protein